MARYSPEFLAALRQRYEQTHESERSLAAAFDIGATTVRRIAERHGWKRPPTPVKGLSPSMALLEATMALHRQASALCGETPEPEDWEKPKRIPVARYTADLIYVMRRRYELTLESTRSIAREVEVSERTLRRIAKTRGWVRPRQVPKDIDRHKWLERRKALIERTRLYPTFRSR
jgi:transposase-like protein